MRLPADAGFWRELARFDLRFCCEDCTFFDPRSERCAHGWPNAEHRRGHYRVEPDPPAEVTYCKEFELI
jgi:hypothetical protein